MSNSKPFYTGSITYVDGLREPIRKGVVRINGGKATLLDAAVDDASKPVQVDVLRNVSVTEDRGEVHLSGQSLLAVRDMKLSGADSQVEVVVDLSGKCKGCQ